MWHLHKRNQISITSSSDIISAFISTAVFAVNPHPSSLSLHLHHNEAPPPAQHPCLVPPEQTGPNGTFHLPPSPSFSFHALPLPWDLPSGFWTLPLPDPLRPPPPLSGPSPTCCLPVSLASVGRMGMGANPYAQFFPFFLSPNLMIHLSPPYTFFFAPCPPIHDTARQTVPSTIPRSQPKR